MFWAVSRLDAATTTACVSSSGCDSDHCSACMPPSDPPTTASKRSMPRWATSARCTATKSLTSSSGKSSPYGCPVSGFVEDGPVLPWQPPIRLAHTTKNRSVSSGLPGPMRLSHQPGRVAPSW